jgi:uncharacterized protein YbjT (DUF2867 family)
MKIAVLGATGRTGQVIVEQALAAKHEVTALVRRPEGLSIRNERLNVIIGDARDASVIEKLVEGKDGIISSLGLPASGTTRAEVSNDQRVDVCVASTELLFATMPKYGVKRIVLMSTHGAGASQDGSPYVNWLRELVGERVKDKDSMEAFIAASNADVEWTVIRNPRIYEGSIGQKYDVYEKIILDRSSKITYADLSYFTLSEITSPKHIGQFLTITEPLDNEEFMVKARRALPCR